jgi:hypothetical protein
LKGTTRAGVAGVHRPSADTHQGERRIHMLTAFY